MEQLGQFIMHHWPLWFGLFIVLMLILMNEWWMQKNRAKALSPTEVVEMINDNHAVIIDIRDLGAFQTGHITGAIRLPASDLSLEQLKKYEEKPLILVCSRGLDAAKIAAKWRSQGIRTIMLLSGGMTAWQNAGLPTVKK